MLRTNSILVAVLLLLLSFVGQVWPAWSQGIDKPASSPRVVRIQLKWQHQFQFAGFYAAIDQGYFHAAGLDVRLIPGGPDIDPAQVVIGGGAEFGIGNSSLLINHAWGAPVVAVAAILQHSPFILAASHAPGLDGPHHLEGRKIMLEAHAAELLAFLKLADVDMTQVQVLPHSGKIHDLGERVDAISAYSSDETYSLLTEKISHQLFNPRAIGIDFYGDTLFTSSRLAADDPALVRAVREAVIKGWYYALEHPNRIMRLIGDTYAPGIDPLKLQYEADEIRRLMDADVVGIGYMNVKRWDAIANVFLHAGMIAAPVEMSAFLFDATDKPDLGWVYRLLAVGGAVLVLVVAVSVHMSRLNRALRREIEERRRLEEILTHQASTDPLTGLCNRRHFAQRASEEMRRARRSGAALSVLYMDLDHFKTINDRFGHGFGDQVLINVAKACHAALREEDVLARLGGEEFGALLPGLDRTAGVQVAERLLGVVRGLTLRTESGDDVRVALSIGVTEIDADDADMLSGFDRADRALYRAKTLGRDRVALA